MKVNETDKTVTVSKLEMHRNMMKVFDMVTAGYKVTVTSYRRPVAYITDAQFDTEFITE